MKFPVDSLGKFLPTGKMTQASSFRWDPIYTKQWEGFQQGTDILALWAKEYSKQEAFLGRSWKYLFRCLGYTRGSTSQ
jgi:hypothetical protein